MKTMESCFHSFLYLSVISITVSLFSPVKTQSQSYPASVTSIDLQDVQNLPTPQEEIYTMFCLYLSENDTAAANGGGVEKEIDSLGIKAVNDSLQPQPMKPQQLSKDKTIQARKETTNKSDTGSGSIQQLWKSQPFTFNIHGIAVSDVDNDTKTDVLIVTEKNIRMHHFENGNLSKGSDIYKIRLQYPIGIDIADINKNGFPEIFITAFDADKKSIISFVIEYDGKEFKLVNKSLPWYFRAVTLKDTVPVLFGQKHRKNTPFRGNIFTLKWSDTTYTYARRWSGFGAKGVNAEWAELKDYIPCKEIAFSIDMNAIGLAYGDIMNNGQNVIVAYDKSNNINMLDTNGKKIWESPEQYGGSTFYHQHESKSPGAQGEREYLPMRIQIGDINSDGTHEIIAIKNYEVTRNIFDKFKLYKEHHIELITWDGFSFNTYCKSGIIHGFVRDFAISDLNNDGKKELITVVATKEGKSLISKAESYLAAYTIN